MSQKSKIRKHLESGKRITAIQALSKFGCYRLAARIDNLRKSGMDITSRMVSRKGKRFAEYYMVGEL